MTEKAAAMYDAGAPASAEVGEHAPSTRPPTRDSLRRHADPGARRQRLHARIRALTCGGRRAYAHRTLVPRRDDPQLRRPALPGAAEVLLIRRRGRLPSAGSISIRTVLRSARSSSSASTLSGISTNEAPSRTMSSARGSGSTRPAAPRLAWALTDLRPPETRARDGGPHCGSPGQLTQERLGFDPRQPG